MEAAENGSADFRRRGIAEEEEGGKMEEDPEEEEEEEEESDSGVPPQKIPLSIRSFAKALVSSVTSVVKSPKNIVAREMERRDDDDDDDDGEDPGAKAYESDDIVKAVAQLSNAEWLSAISRQLSESFNSLRNEPFDEWRALVLDACQNERGEKLIPLSWGEDTEGVNASPKTLVLESRAILRFSATVDSMEISSDKPHVAWVKIPEDSHSGWPYGSALVWVARVALLSFACRDERSCEVRIRGAKRGRCHCTSSRDAVPEDDLADEEEGEEIEKEADDDDDDDDGGATPSSSSEADLDNELMRHDALSRDKNSWVIDRHCFWGTFLRDQPSKKLEEQQISRFGPRKVVVRKTAETLLAVEVLRRSKIDDVTRRDIDRAMEDAGNSTSFAIRESAWKKIRGAFEKEMQFCRLSDFVVRVARSDGTPWQRDGEDPKEAAFEMGLFVEFLHHEASESSQAYYNVLRPLERSSAKALGDPELTGILAV